MNKALYTGVVESRDDPLKLGRCQVRIVGLHTDDKAVLPTADLPWAYPMQPVTSAAMNGIGWTPVGPVPGTWVVIMFHDDEFQMPIMIGTIGGIPQSKAAERVIDNSDSMATDGGVLTDANGNAVKSSDGKNISVGTTVNNIVGEAVGGVLNQIANALGFDLGKIGINTTAKEVKSPAIGADSDRTETITPKIETKEETKIDAQPQPGKATAEVIAKDIPIEPPPKYAKNASEAKKAIQAILKYCDQMGFTSKYAKCAILAICGGESGWSPVEEGYSYSESALLQVFRSVFKGQEEKAKQYARWKGSRADFFRFIYSPSYANGKGAGNKLPDDGALFYGRGFVQITGRTCYEAVQKELTKYGINVDIVKNPNQVISDIDTCAAVAVGFYKMKQSTRILKVSQDDPNFIEAALKATGNDAVVNGISGYAKKRKIYEYFLGQGVVTDSTNKPAANENPTYTKEEVAGLPANKQAALLEDRTENATIGFKDPTGKYPLRNLLDEPDTNRLARGVIKETAIAFKDQSRTKGITTANDAEAEWEQPLAPFGGQYPYAKVYESESGHVQVFDDTPGNEYISLYHRKGTFIDVDANGTQVNKIIGDGYTIIDRNGFVQITGRCNIFIGNNANIKVEGNCDLEVNGATTANFHSDVDIGCARDVTWAIGGDFSLKVDGKFSTTVGGDVSEAYQSNHKNQVTGSITTISDSFISTEAKSNITVNTEAMLAVQAKDEVSIKTDAAMKTSSKGEYTVKADSAIRMSTADAYKVTSTGDMDIRSNSAVKMSGVNDVNFRALSGAVNIHGSSSTRIQQNTAAVATSTTAPVGNEVDALEKFHPLTISAPEMIGSQGNKYEILTTPIRPAPQEDIKGPLEGDVASSGYNATAAEDGVNDVRPPQPNVGDPTKGEPPAQGTTFGDIGILLKKIHQQAQEGHWNEIGMKDNTSCAPMIQRMWDDLGLSGVPKNGVQFGGKLVKGDQVPWCAAFVNHVLKQAGHRWAKEARAYGFTENPGRWNATRVTSDPQPGDVIVWNYSHVSFVYEVAPDGTFSCIGGNQGGKANDNNPVGGLVTVNYKGTNLKNPKIKAVFRIPKA